jgi:hypothetical protein
MGLDLKNLRHVGVQDLVVEAHLLIEPLPQPETMEIFGKRGAVRHHPL